VRFSLKLEPLLTPVFFPFGVTSSQSWVDVNDATFHVCFGWLMNRDFDRRLIADVTPATWSLLGGLGLRTNLVSSVAVVGSTSGVVKVTFRDPVPVRVLFEVPCRELYLAVEDPAGLIEALRPR
jgi:hypothetical protein